MKKIKTKTIAIASMMGMLSLLVLPSATFAADQVYTRTITVRNTNTADVVNSITVTANTGENLTVAGAGGAGAAGGSASGPSAQEGGTTHIIAGDGGDGGAGGMGGIITTGDAVAEVSVDSEINLSDTSVGSGSTTTISNDSSSTGTTTSSTDIDMTETVLVENVNDLAINNGATVDVMTGENQTIADDGGAGAAGGNATATVDGEDSGEGETMVHAGQGGNGGAGGMGGDILTGRSSTRIDIVNVVNRSITRVSR